MTDLIQEKIQEGIKDKIFSGAQFLVGKGEEILFDTCAGTLSFSQNAAPVTPQTLFDVSSLTKPIVTTSLILKLVDQGKIKLDMPLAKVLPDFLQEEERGGSQKERVTIRHLLKHMSGLPSWKPYFKDLKEQRPDLFGTDLAKDWYLSKISQEALIYPPAYVRTYSDLGFMLLGILIEKLNAQSLDKSFQEQFAAPLDLQQTRFFPLGRSNLQGISLAATENCAWRQKLLQGEVHDDNAYAMGGVAGHAGLFQNARDCHRFLVELQKGLKGQSPHFSQDKLLDFIGPKNKVKAGWDSPEPEGSQAGSHFSYDTIGHLGFTGCSVWLDLGKEVHMILLTNRVHVSREDGRIKTFRPVLHDLAHEQVLGGV